MAVGGSAVIKVNPVTGNLYYKPFTPQKTPAQLNAEINTRWNNASAAMAPGTDFANTITDIWNAQTSGDGKSNLTYDPNELLYNVNCVVGAYHNDAVQFTNNITNTQTPYRSNRPTPVPLPSHVFQSAGGHKGMIATFVPKDSAGSIDTLVPNQDSKLQPSNQHRYGFQFHYNPTAIRMVYAGAPNTDVGLEVSGNEKFNLAGANVSQSTLNVEIILNRVRDRNFYESGVLSKKVNPKEIYGERVPSVPEQIEIYNKGTMYDIEYLLATVIGYKLNTAYRDVTADVGWISGRPVELRLGKSLNYLGFINSFTIDHLMFTPDMVPTLSKAQLSFNRIPDYSGMV
jgi:hypothetical protein